MKFKNNISIIGGAGHVGFPLGLIFASKQFKCPFAPKVKRRSRLQVGVDLGPIPPKYSSNLAGYSCFHLIAPVSAEKAATTSFSSCCCQALLWVVVLGSTARVRGLRRS